MSQIDRWNETADLFDARARKIEGSQWGDPTPCPEWNVEALVNHVAGTHIFFGSLLGLPDVGPKWRDVRQAMAALLEDPDTLSGTAEVPGMGEMPKTAILDICIYDMLIHTWDLSRAIGADDTLPPDTAEAGFAWLQTLPPSILRAPGRFGDPVPVGADADAQTRLLAFAGRTP